MELIAYVLAVIIAIQAILHAIERKDLYNRIMSRDIADYKVLKSDKPVKPVVPKYKKVMTEWRKGKREEGENDE